MDIFKKLNYILDKKQKINIVVLAVMIFIGGILMQNLYNRINIVNGLWNFFTYRICKDLSLCC